MTVKGEQALGARRFVKGIPIVGPVARRVFATVTGAVQAARILRHVIDAHSITLMSDEDKRVRILDIAHRFGTRVFIETGTYFGRTTRFVAPAFELCITIEVDTDLYERAKAGLKDLGNVTVLHGDSKKLMPAILETLDTAALFWLDAHYSGGVTSRADEDTPIQQELQTIFGHHIRDHVILVDDARDFLGVNGYPTIRALRDFVRDRGNGYALRIQNDLMLIYRPS